MIPIEGEEILERGLKAFANFDYPLEAFSDVVWSRSGAVAAI